MLALIVVLLLALLLFGFGFSLHLLWIIAAIVLAVWVIGFLVRPGGTGPGATRGRWYYW
jgi:hypothetical protein